MKIKTYALHRLPDMILAMLALLLQTDIATISRIFQQNLIDLCLFLWDYVNV